MNAFRYFFQCAKLKYECISGFFFKMLYINAFLDILKVLNFVIFF